MLGSVHALDKFHLVVTPGFEDLALHELLNTNAQITDVKRLKGGIDFTAERSTGYALNAILKIPTRILLRLGEKKAKSFDELRSFMNEVPWEDYFLSAKVKLKISSFKSKLYHKVQLEDVMTRALRAYFREKEIEVQSTDIEALKPEIIVRIEHNFVQLSISTSGEALFKRGYKNLSAVAPLRENLAYGCIYKLWLLLDQKVSIKLLDPMCGSGTFLTEALLFNQSMDRHFAFEDFPGQLNSLPKLSAKKNCQFIIEAWDHSAAAIEGVQKSFSSLGAKNVILKNQSFFEKSSAEYDGILFNPPYGHRIRLPLPPNKFWPQLVNHLSTFNAQFYAFVAPLEANKFLPSPLEKIEFSNGGLPVSLFIYTKNTYL